MTCSDGCFNKPDRWIRKESKYKMLDRVECRKCGKWIGYAPKEEGKQEASP